MSRIASQKIQSPHTERNRGHIFKTEEVIRDKTLVIRRLTIFLL